jgi:transposase
MQLELPAGVMQSMMEQLDYNLLFRWFVGLVMDESVW